MRRQIAGLGILAFIFSLHLFFLGTPETKQVSKEVLCSQLDTTPLATLSGSGEIDLHEGLLQPTIEISEVHQTVRRFPVGLSVLFLLFNTDVEESPAFLSTSCCAFFPSKDLPVSFRNLRI